MWWRRRLLVAWGHPGVNPTCGCAPTGMPKVEITAKENGPNLVMVDGKVSMALCRCGHSSQKPMCDGAHRKAEFKAEAAHLVVLD